MDVTSLISSFATGTYTVTRRARGRVRQGHVQDGVSSTVTITAAVHPAGGKDLQRLPEGRRADATFAVYSATELYLGGQGDAYEADQISINGTDWEVQHVERWQDSATGNVGYKYLVQDVP